MYVNDLVNCRDNGPHSFVILYADDILILTSSITELQRLFQICETELIWLDMAINISKSCCLRIGPRFDKLSCAILTVNGMPLPWVNELRYLGVYILNSRIFRCSISHAKRNYHRALNAIVGKIGNVASEEVVLQLVASKCIPILMYGTEVCGLIKSDLHSLDFPVNRFLMKLFRTANSGAIKDCLHYFWFNLPSVLIVERKLKFVSAYNACNNVFCKLFNTDKSRFQL